MLTVSLHSLGPDEIGLRAAARAHDPLAPIPVGRRIEPPLPQNMVAAFGAVQGGGRTAAGVLRHRAAVSPARTRRVATEDEISRQHNVQPRRNTRSSSQQQQQQPMASRYLSRPLSLTVACHKVINPPPVHSLPRAHSNPLAYTHASHPRPRPHRVCFFKCCGKRSRLRTTITMLNLQP